MLNDLVAVLGRVGKEGQPPPSATSNLKPITALSRPRDKTLFSAALARSVKITISGLLPIPGRQRVNDPPRS